MRMHLHSTYTLWMTTNGADDWPVDGYDRETAFYPSWLYRDYIETKH